MPSYRVIVQLALTPDNCRRPRQLYVGEGERDYVEIESRSEKVSEDPTKAPVPIQHFHSKRVFLARDAKL